MEGAFKEKMEERIYHPGGLIGRPFRIRGSSSPLQARVASVLKSQIFPSEEGPVKIEIQWDPNLTPPIARSARVGEVCVIDELGQLLCKEELVAAAPVDATLTYRISQLWNHWGQRGKLLAMVMITLMCGLWIWALTRPTAPKLRQA